MVLSVFLPFSFFFNDTATTEIYTLSLHDALPISAPGPSADGFRGGRVGCAVGAGESWLGVQAGAAADRLELEGVSAPTGGELRRGSPLGKHPRDQGTGAGAAGKGACRALGRKPAPRVPRPAPDPRPPPEGFQNAGSARERSAVALSSLVAPLRGGAICRLTRARANTRSCRASQPMDRCPRLKPSALLPLASGDESIGPCSFRSPILPSRLCCGCWSGAGAASSPRTLSYSCCGTSSPCSDGKSDDPCCGQLIGRCLRRSPDCSRPADATDWWCATDASAQAPGACASEMGAAAAGCGPSADRRSGARPRAAHRAREPTLGLPPGSPASC